MKLILGVLFVLALIAFAFAARGADDVGPDDSRPTAVAATGAVPTLYGDSGSSSGAAEAELETDCEREDDMGARVRCRVKETVKVRGVEVRGANASQISTSATSVREACGELQGTRQVACMARYRVIEKCPFLPTMRASDVCVRNQLRITENVRERVRECDDDDSNASACRAGIADDVDTLVISRFEVLKERALRLQEKGAGDELVATFIANVELKVVEYESAQTVDGKKQVVRDVARLWREFVKSAVQEIRAANAAGGVS